jgi:hypothetical protein
LAQAGFKLAMVTTFGQPRFRATPSLAGGYPLPLRVVSRTDPAWRWFDSSSFYHHGPELVLLPDLAFFYASAAPPPSLSSSSSSSSSSSPSLPSSPLSRVGKGKEKSAKKDKKGKKESNGNSAKELQQVVEDELEGEHRMETYLRNLKAKVRGTPYRAASV